MNLAQEPVGEGEASAQTLESMLHCRDVVRDFPYIIQGRARILTDGSDFARGADLLLAKYPQYRVMGLDRESGLMIKVDSDRVTQWRYAS